MGRSDVVADRLKGLAAGFARYADAYDELTPFTSEQARTHRDTIAGLKAAGSVEAAVCDHDFVVGLYKTLQAWRMGMRASYLVTEDEFVRMVRQAAPAIAELERFRINDPHPPADIADRIWRVMDSLGGGEEQGPPGRGYEDTASPCAGSRGPDGP